MHGHHPCILGSFGLPGLWTLVLPSLTVSAGRGVWWLVLIVS